MTTIKKKSKCNKKNTICLNSKKDQKTLLKHVTSIYKSGSSPLSRDKYSFFYLKNSTTDEEHKFELKVSLIKSKEKEVQLMITDNTKKGYCLKMTFSKFKKHSVSQIYYGFNKSYINQIQRGICGYMNNKKKLTLSGSYILNVVNRLNDIFEVSSSTLRDDSRLEICDRTVSIKMINLFKYGKTWYERMGEFTLDNKEIYKRTKIVGEMRLSQLYNNLLEIDNDIMKSDFIDFPNLNNQEIEKVSQLLDKINMSKNSKIKNLISKIFERKSPYTECEQLFLWNFILNLKDRKFLAKTNDEKYKLVKEYYKLQEDRRKFSKSTRHIKRDEK